MRKLTAAVTIVVLCSLIDAAAADALPPCGPLALTRCAVESADDGIVTVIERGRDGVPGVSPPKAAGPIGRPAARVIVEKRYVPTCLGNEVGGESALCDGSTLTCPAVGDVRFWVYSRRFTEGSLPPPFERVLQPPFVCLGPDDPAIDPTIAIPAIVERDFKRVVVLKGVAEVSPAPDTLVNVETRFRTSAPASYEIPLTVLGQSVVIKATAAAWTWHFGDGTEQRLTGGSNTVHTYERAATHGAYVVIEWTGTFRIGGDATVRRVNGTATTTGDPVTVTVKEARTELVDQPG